MKKYICALLLTTTFSAVSLSQNQDDFYPRADSTWYFRQITGLYIGDAGLNGRSDALDGFFRVSAYGTTYNPEVMDTSGLFLTAPAQSFPSIEISKQYWFHPDKPLVRVLIRVHNTIMEGEPVLLTVYNNYGSDQLTQLYRTSENTMEVSDTTRWMVSHDSDTIGGDPILTYVQRGIGSLDCTTQVQDSGAVVSGDLYTHYSFNVPSGQDRYILLFCEMHTTPSAAATDAAVYNSNATLAASGYLAGIPESAYGAIVNWDLASVLGFTEPAAISFNAFPNPTTGSFTVQLETAQPATLNLRSLTGQLLETQELEETSSANFTIAQPQGIYLLEVRTADGRSSVIKIVKE